MMMRVWDRKFSQAVDRISTSSYGISSLHLMENAGKAVFKRVVEICGDLPILVLAGTGNNGGDALVAARYLLNEGKKVFVFLVGKGKATDSCESQIAALKNLGKAPITPYTKGTIEKLAFQSAIVVDGVFGIGFKGPIRPGDGLDALSEAASITNKTVLAIDVPSGLDADVGLLPENKVPLPANFTVTFGGLKPAHILSPSRQVCGKIFLEEIGFSDDAIRDAEKTCEAFFSVEDTQTLINNDPSDSLGEDIHKFDRGHVLVIGGSTGKIGAPLLSAYAALRAGAGWVSLALPVQIKKAERLVGFRPEITFEDFFADGVIDLGKLEDFVFSRKVKAIVLGPGCVNQPLAVDAIALLSSLCKDAKCCLVFDAGATRGIIDLAKKVSFIPSRTIVTAHPGEWRKLASSEIPPPVSPDALPQVCNTANKIGAVFCYKSATPILVRETLPAFVSLGGSKILARAGSGDVISGVCGALAGLGLNAAGAFLRAHAIVGQAARLAAEEVGPNSVLALDIIDRMGTI